MRFKMYLIIGKLRLAQVTRKRFNSFLFNSSVLVMLVLFNCNFNHQLAGESCKTSRKHNFESACILPWLVNGNDSLDILLPDCLLVYLRINDCPPESKLNQAIGHPK